MSPIRCVFVVAIVLCPALQGCHQANQLDGVASSLDPGFKAFPTPRDFDGPATVFRVSNGTKYPVAELKLATGPAGREALYNLTRKRTWSVNALATYLGAAKVVSSASATAEADSNLTSTIMFGPATRMRISDMDKLPAAIKDLGINFDRNSSYFVIVETIAVRSLDVDADSTGNASASAKAKFTAIVDANAGVKWGNDRHTTLKQTFDKPYNVFYTTQQILPPGSGLNSTGAIEVIKLEASEQPGWSAESSRH